ncbi:hypothetical protein BTVI_156714 [Pitangus sulphuratus]|nr:hypothetical protein BTVI_156714 [Pitangus sulphuratus]
MPASSRMDFLWLANAKPIRSDSNASVITYLRTEGYCEERIPARDEQSENIGTTMETPMSMQKEGQEVLQVPELRHGLPVSVLQGPFPVHSLYSALRIEA